MKSIALLGEWNTTNIGDRAIGIHATRYLLSFGFNVKVIALGSLHYLGEVSNAEQLDEVFSALPKASYRTKGFLKGKMSRIVHKYFPGMKFFFRFWRNHLNRQPLRKQLSLCKAVFVGGGALLDDDGLHFPSSLFLIKRMCQRLHLPILTVGCSSSGKFSRTGKFILKDFMNYADVVAVRDKASRQALQPLCNKDIYIFGDFALGTGHFRQENLTGKLKSISVNVMHFTGDDGTLQPGYELFLTQLIGAFRKRDGLSVTLFTTGDVNDLAIAKKIHAMTDLNSPIFHPATFQEMIAFFKGNDAVFCTRLHSAIMAINENIPAIALWATPKIKNFFQTIGLKDFCIHAVPQNDINQMINELLEMKLREYFSLINLDYFAEGHNKVSTALTTLARHPDPVKEPFVHAF